MPEQNRMNNAEKDSVQEFAQQLSDLRLSVGNPAFRKMAERSGSISHTTLHEAASGARFPSWATTREFVRLCGGDEAEWRVKWEQARPPRPAETDELTGTDQPSTNSGPAVADSAPTLGSDGKPPSPRRGILLATAALSAVILAVVAASQALSNGGTGSDPSRATATPGPTATPAPQPSVPLVPGDGIKFIADVTIPDGTVVKVNQHFIKIWEIKNDGKAHWKNRWAERADLPADSGACETPKRIRVPDTPPGGHAMVKVRVIAPPVPETCWVAWKMVNEEGQHFFPSRRPIFFTVNAKE